jgi:hypothetical protein
MLQTACNETNVSICGNFVAPVTAQSMIIVQMALFVLILQEKKAALVEPMALKNVLFQ